MIVDDASPDGTADLAEKVGADQGDVLVVRRPAKLGLGSAYRDGFAHLAGMVGADDVVVTMDCDLSHDPAVIPELIRRLVAGADVAIGSRYVPGGSTADWPWHRRVLSRWGNRYTSVVLRLGVRDCTSGFRAYRASMLTAIEPETTTAEGYAFLTELARRLVAAGARIEEHPIRFVDRDAGSSKMSGRIVVESMLLVTRWALHDTLRGWRHRRRTAPSA
jgi:dolichol-phosphate mannosyltransferase